MKEREWQAWVTRQFEDRGWRVFHVPTPMRPTKGGRFVPDPRGRGLPDLLCLHEDPPRAVWIENKTNDGELSTDQIEVLRLLRAVALRATEPQLAAALRNEPGRAIPYEPAVLGVYVFKPGMEHLVEAVASGGYRQAA